MSEIYESNINGYVNGSESVSNDEKIYSAPARVIYPYNSALDFPTTGKINALYIDKSTSPNVAYRWDTDSSGYVPVGGEGGVSDYTQLSNLPTINGTTIRGDMMPENIGAFPMFTGADETDPDTSLKGLMFVQCSDELKEILGMPRAYIHQYFYSTGAIAENQTRVQIATAYGYVAKTAIRQYYGDPKAWTAWAELSGGSGEDSIGIQSVEQTTTSTEDNGENVITVTKTDGTKSTFTVRNGSKGSGGTSPTVETAEIENGHEVTFTDVDGSKVIKIMDGAALLYVVSKGETIEDARIAAKAAGAKFIFNPYASNSVEYVTAESFDTLFDARNGAVLLWSGAKAAGAGATFTIGTSEGTTGCTGEGNLSDYSLFYFIVLGSVPCLMALADGVMTGGAMIYSALASSNVSRGIRATVSGNTFTIAAHHTSSDGAVSSNITAIYGIPIR